jgi:hypothetical protein
MQDKKQIEKTIEKYLKNMQLEMQRFANEMMGLVFKEEECKKQLNN